MTGEPKMAKSEEPVKHAEVLTEDVAVKPNKQRHNTDIDTTKKLYILIIAVAVVLGAGILYVNHKVNDLKHSHYSHRMPMGDDFGGMGGGGRKYYDRQLNN
jgi:hypothetical protein